MQHCILGEYLKDLKDSVCKMSTFEEKNLLTKQEFNLLHLFVPTG